jgi:hypothetical protein
MTELLAADATFHSAVTDYRGQERVARVLDALVEVVTDVRVTRLLESAQGIAASFAAGGDGRQADAVLLALAAADAPATELTLMLRPPRTLRVGIEQMTVLVGRCALDLTGSTWARRGPVRKGGRPPTMTCVSLARWVERRQVAARRRW